MLASIVGALPHPQGDSTADHVKQIALWSRSASNTSQCYPAPVARSSRRGKNGRSTAVAAMLVLGSCTSKPMEPAAPEEQGEQGAEAQASHAPAAADTVVHAPAPSRCRDHDDQARFEACLGEVAPGPSWKAASGAPDPQGYVCAFFGGPQRSCDAIRTLRSWIEGGPKCPRSFSLYLAQHPGWAPDGKMLDLGEGRPPNDPRIFSFDSDGTHFAFLRLFDYVVEARACMDATSTDADLMDWAKLLQPEVFGDSPTTESGP